MMTQLDSLFIFPVLIPGSVRQRAHIIAQSFSDQVRSRQAYGQQIARYAVGYYLQSLGYEITEEESLSLTFLHQALLNSAVLKLAGYGSVDCHWLSEGIQEIEVPLDIHNDRVGHIFVEFEQGEGEAKIVGFVAAVASGSIVVSEMRSLAELPEYLGSLPSCWETAVTDLGDWFSGMFDAGWQALSEVFTPSQLEPAFSTRNDSTLTRGKTISLGDEQPAVILVLSTYPTSDETVEVLATLRPSQGRQYLPDSIQMTVLAEDHSQIANFYPQPDNKNFQFRLGCTTGECFTIQLDVENTRIAETFVI